MNRNYWNYIVWAVLAAPLILLIGGLVNEFTYRIDKEAEAKEAEKIRAACLPAPGQTSRMKWQDGKLLCEIAQFGYGVYKPVKMIYIAEIDKN